MLNKARKVLERATHFKEKSTSIKIIHNILEINNLAPSAQYNAGIEPLTQAIKNSIDYSKYLTLSEEDRDWFCTLVAIKLNEMAGNVLFKSPIFQKDTQITEGIFQSCSTKLPTIFKKISPLKDLSSAENKESKDLATKSGETPETFLTGIRDIDTLILYYINFTHEDKGITRKYSLLTMGCTFFEKNVAVIALLGHVARGEQQQANAMLKKNPLLLLESGRTTDYTCTADGSHYRTLEGTAYRIALGAKDVKLHPKEECMVEMITRHFKRLPNWQVEMKKQYDDQFPAADPAKGIKGWFAEAQERAMLDSLELKKVFQAVHDAKPENNTYEACERACDPALQEFRNYLDNQIKGKIFRTGFYFNDLPVDEKEQKDVTYGLLGESFKLYANYFSLFGNSHDSPKSKLCWRKIIGYIERFFPACLAQAFCMDLYNYVHGGKLEKRPDLKYNSYIWFPLKVSSGVGYDWAAGSLTFDEFTALDPSFSKFMTNKNRSIAVYRPALAANVSSVRNNI